MPIRLCFSFRNFILICAVSVLFFGHSACLAQQNVAETCAHGTWAACGVAVKSELDKKPSDPKRIIELAGLWGRSYSVRFDALRKNGKIEKSIPDSDKIFEAVSAKLNPVDIAKDKTVDALVKTYLPRVAAVLEWADKPLIVAFKVFFDSSEIATDYDELRLMDHDLQGRIAQLLEPYLLPDWKSKLNDAVRDAAPQLRRL